MVPLRSGALVAAVAAILLAGRAAAAEPPARPLNVLLISIDTCRPDHLSAYASGHAATPNIDAVARGGVLFRQAYTTNPLTLPAHTSMLTGVTPLVHGVHDNNNDRLAASVVTLAERLHGDGLATAAFIGAFVLDSQFGLARGFDVYDDRFKVPVGAGYASYAERRADEVSRGAIAWLEQHREAPFFLFVHYFDPHQPYVPPAPFDARYADAPYDGEIAFTDQEIGHLLDALARLRLADSTLVVITGDHGQAFGEHGEEMHGFLVYQPTIRVPLIMRAPGGRRGAVVDEPVSLVDVVPTVLALRGMAVPPELEGRDLSALVSGRGQPPPPHDLYFECVVPAEYGCTAIRGLVRGRWKYLRSATSALYDLSDDPGETRDRAPAEVETARSLGERLDGLLAAAQHAPAAAAPLDAGTAERLKALGYLAVDVAGGPTHADATACLDLYTRATTAQGLFSVGRFDDAVAAMRTLVAEHPEYASGYSLLGDIALQQGRFPEAAQHLERYLALIEGAPEAQAGRARRAYDRAHAHNGLGNALQAMNRMDEAKMHYVKALRLMPAFGEAAFNLAVVAESKDSYAKADRLYARAFAHMPDAAAARAKMPTIVRAHLERARELRAEGRLDDARRNLERARTLAPNDPEVQAELAALGASAGG